MQTFLPYPSLLRSVQCLDNKRLNKQCSETKQILRLVIAKTYIPHVIWENLKFPWFHHPAVKMWYNYSYWLLRYQAACVNEWCFVRKGKGYDKYWKQTLRFFKRQNIQNLTPAVFFNLKLGEKPRWFGNYDFHLSHQSNLLRKNLEHYSKWFDTDVPTNLEYIWPI